MVLCDHNVTDAYSSEYHRKNVSSEAFQQDREWFNSLHFIPIFLSVCHSHIADLVGMSNAIAILYLILYKCVNNVHVESTDNKCVPNLKTKTFSPDFYDRLLTLLKPVDSGVLTVISSWLTDFFFYVLFQLLKHLFLQHITHQVHCMCKYSNCLLTTIIFIHKYLLNI